MVEAAPGVLKVTDWYSLRKTVFYDTNYRCSWVNNSAELARACIGSGFAPLTAFQLREWMRAQTAGGAEGSICFFAQDIVPDMVAEKCSPHCLVMEYMKAGGRVVWVGDIPFYYQGQRGKKLEIWGVNGHKKILGLACVNDLHGEVRLTDAGREWGLTRADNPSRCVPAGDVTAALTLFGRNASSFFKNYARHFPQSGFLRLREFLPVQDLLRAAQYGIEEPEDDAEPTEPPERFRAQTAVCGGELVSSGTFVVDRQRALDKLMRFQLPDPETCLLPVMRCALAGKASKIIMQGAFNNELQVHFDGEPFSRDRLSDPYAALFESRTPANSAARHLATGLLCALRLKPKFITITSGADGSRFRLRIDALGREQLQQSVAPGEGTVLRIIWRGVVSPFRNRSLLSHVPERCFLSPVPIWINDVAIPRGRAASGEPGIYFEEGRLNGVIAVPKWPSPSSILSAAVNNVTLDAPVSAKLHYLQVSGYLNNDDFMMNISQTGVVNNSRYTKVIAVVARNIPKLLEYVLRGQREDLAAAGRVMAYGGMHTYWRKCIESGKPLEPGLLSGLVKAARSVLIPEAGEAAAKREKAERLVRRTVLVTLWLREACGRLLTEYKKDSSDPLLKALWEAPVFLTINAEPRSLRQIDEQRQRIGFVPYSTGNYPDILLPFDVLWCPSRRDLEPLRLWDTADLTEKLPRYGVNPAAAEEFLGGSDPGLVAIRHNIEIIPSSRDHRGAMQPVEISLSNIKEPAPEPAPPPPAPVVPAVTVPEPPPPRRPAPPLPTEEQLAEDPAAHFPEFLARQAARVKAKGARLVAKFIRERASKGKWMKNSLVEDILDSRLPPLRKAEYLLSVFYTDFNRREVELTDADDMKFQRALLEQITGRQGGKNNGKKK